MAISKRHRPQVEQLLADVLNPQPIEIVVLRAEECEVLYMNTAAKKRMEYTGEEENMDCKLGYSRLFRGLCGKCPGVGEPQALGKHESFDVRDESGRVFSATCTTFEWLDGKPATICFLQDIDEIRSAENKLYKLAYIDQLTNVPNRQKFREDFEALEECLANGSRRGVLAIFDLDNFKAVNDTYGHNTGDIMLRRLAEHMQNEKAFAGHIYRLGGDEFVLLYADASNPHGTEEAYRAHYYALLENALLSYTLPNIDLACTISMGVAFFPQHGTNASEVLRKADIALYKAKAAGRNQMVFFEDQYDTAKKLKDVYINIQPILTAPGRTFGYELADRSGEESGGENEVNLNEFDRATDALGLDDIENDAHYFIGYSEQLHNPAVRNNLPKDKFIIQIHLPDKYKDETLKSYVKLKSYGYSLAMAGIKASNAVPAVLALADYCKFEPGAMSELQQNQLIANNKGKTFIATDVNTPAAFEAAKKRGFRLFQGYYFSSEPPVTRKTKEIDPLKVNYFRLLKLTSTNDYVDFKEISEIIGADVALSYKLLRLLNSAAVGLRYKVSSIAMAVAYLGEENLKKWIALLALRGVAADKPLELMRMSMIRAQFGELLGPLMRPRRNPKHVFLTGMLSLLHIAMDKSKEELMDEIPVAEDIRDSLLTDSGPFSDLLAFFNSYEYANWDEVNRFSEENGLSCQDINDCYIAAVKWYNELTSEA